MPPADSNAPTPPPAGGSAPETPKPEKVGFFAKLFGKKPKEEPVPADHESHTPPAQLSDASVRDTFPTEDSSASTDLAAPAPTPDAPVAAEEMPSMPEGNPGDEDEDKPPTLDVPPSISAEEPKVDEGMTVPPVTDVPSTEEFEDKPADPSVPKF